MSEELELKGKDFERPKESEDSSSPKDFDDILEVVGGYGRYQKRLLYGFLVPLFILSPFTFSNRIFMLSEPDHWCHVPGRPNGMELETWKNMTLPLEPGADGRHRFSKCEMYDANRTKVKCDRWDYDTTNYDSTLITEFNWVCDKEHYTANVWFVNMLGGSIGSVFLQLALDKFGRKRTYSWMLPLFAMLYLISLMLPGYYSAFLVFQFFSGPIGGVMTSAPLMIATEIVGRESRAWVYTTKHNFFVVGSCLLPLIAYLLRSWFALGLLTPALALLGYSISYWILPESPRWLLSAGRKEEAIATLQEIARVNGTVEKPEELTKEMNKLRGPGEGSAEEGESPEKQLQFWTLFTSRTLIIRTLLIGFAVSANGIIFGGLFLNITNLAGNEFLNFFLFTVIEFPVGLTGGYVANRYGRRWTKTVSLVLTGVVFAVAAGAVSSPNSQWTLIACAAVGNFLLAVLALIVDLHTAELYPTPLRSTGGCFAGIVSSILSQCTPYIVLLGKSYAAAPYIIFMTVSLIVAGTSPFLPETVNRKLPQTMEEANSLGKGHKFWSYLPKD